MKTDIHEEVTSCLAPSSPHGNDFGPTEKDFAGYKAVIDERMTDLSRGIISLISASDPSLEDVQLLSLVTILRGEHSSPSMWTTETSCRLSETIFKAVSSQYENSHGTSFSQDTKLVKTVLSQLRPKLLAANFRSHPATVTCYGWFLRTLQPSAMSDFLQHLLPTALIIADDYEPQNIKLGLECLHHIIENAAMEKLKWYGHDEVIMDVLKKCMYQKEPDIVSAHLKCFISLMYNSLRHNRSLKRNNFDEIINNVLVNVYMEQSMVLRRIYASCIPDLIEARGLGVVRHLTMLMKILSEYCLESSTTKHSLKALAKIVQVCWSRGDTVGKDVLVVLMKLLIVASHPPTVIRICDISSDVHLLADLLNEAFPTVVNQYLEEFHQNRTLVDKDLTSLVDDVFNVASSNN